MYYIPYNKNLKEFSQHLRKNSSLGEVLLWRVLKSGQLKGYKFNRQKPLDKYIVDFYCKELNLVIEIDGQYHLHLEVAVKDDEKENILRDLNLHLIRFTERQIRYYMPTVIDQLQNVINGIESGELKIREK